MGSGGAQVMKPLTVLEESRHLPPRERLRSVRTGKLYHVDTQRETWDHWCPGRFYWKALAFHLAWDSAVLASERLRRQGTVRYVHELPVLVLQGAKSELVVADIGSDTPFECFELPKDCRFTLSGLCEAFSPYRFHTIMRFLLPANTVPAVNGPLTTWRYHPRERRPADAWKPKLGEYRDVGHLESLGAGLHRRLSRAALN
jgi:hypothetical protein